MWKKNKVPLFVIHVLVAQFHVWLFQALDTCHTREEVQKLELWLNVAQKTLTQIDEAIKKLEEATSRLSAEQMADTSYEIFHWSGEVGPHSSSECQVLLCKEKRWAKSSAFWPDF